MIDYDVDDEKQSTDNSKGSYVSVKFGTLTVTVDEGKLEFIESSWRRPCVSFKFASVCAMYFYTYLRNPEVFKCTLVQASFCCINRWVIWVFYFRFSIKS